MVGARRLSKALDLPNQSELLATSLSRCCLARASSASIFSLITASGMELLNPRPDHTEFGVLGSPIGLLLMAWVASSFWCS